MKTVFTAKIIGKYRRIYPRWYHPLRGHTGIDLNFNYEPLMSPITGMVVGITHQPEMGKCLYVKDVWGSIHIFAHLDRIDVRMYDKVDRGQVVAKTGNTGTISSGAHLHYEIITRTPWLDPKKGGQIMNRIMKRVLYGFSGYNVDPISYLCYLYAYHNVKT